MKSILKTAGIVSLVMVLAGPAFGTITLTNGYWSTSFENMADWTHTSTPATLPNGLVARYNYCANNGGPTYSVPCPSTSTARGEQVLASANNPGGVAGSAAQVHYFNTGTTGNGVPAHNMSSGLTLEFPSQVQEFWFRFYIYYPTTADIHGWKILHYYNGMTPMNWMATPYWETSYIGMYFMDGSSGVVQSDAYPWSWSDANSRQGYGHWIPMEVYLKNSTGSNTNGIFRIWRGTDLIINRTNINTGVAGWTQFDIGGNGDGIRGPANTLIGIRFDDLAVATPAYTGFVDDGNGNKRIGLLSSSGVAPVPPTSNPPQLLIITPK